MAKRKSNKKSAKSKNAKRAKIPEVQPEAPIELRPGFKNQLITSLIKLTLAAIEGPPTCLKLLVRDPRSDFSKNFAGPRWSTDKLFGPWIAALSINLKSPY